MTESETKNTLLVTLLIAAFLIIVGIISLLQGIHQYVELIDWQRSTGSLSFIVEHVFEPYPPILVGLGFIMLGICLIQRSDLILKATVLYCAALLVSNLAEHQLRYLYYQWRLDFGFSIIQSALMYFGLLSIALYIAAKRKNSGPAILSQNWLTLIFLAGLLTALQFIPDLLLYRQ